MLYVWTALKKIIMILKLKVWELSGFAFYGNKDINYDKKKQVTMSLHPIGLHLKSFGVVDKEKVVTECSTSVTQKELLKHGGRLFLAHIA